MADTLQDKTEPATPRRREEARERGQVARSSDFTSAVVLLGAIVVLYVSRDTITGRLLAVLRLCLDPDDTSAVDSAQMVPMLMIAGRAVAEILAPLMLAVTIIALVISFGQVGVVFSWETIKPGLDKMNPLAGLKRMFSARSFVHLLMGLAKMCVLVGVAYYTLRGKLNSLAEAALLSHLALAQMTIDLVFTLGLRLAMALLVLAIIDLVYQKWKLEKDLRMTKEEVREELRRMDGDPHIKRRRRELQMQLAMRRIRAAVPKADVVVTNPTHFAVALQYDSETMSAPTVTAKGADHLAQLIRTLAIEHGVPIVERPPLARALYQSVEVGQEIPAQFYRTVAEVLAYVYELAGQSDRRRPTTAAPAGVSLN
ncbi:MAG: flagellar biosynthesis protein FlhB [Phycisphaerae bacterium]|nr:flagellar biosynthesis protein FlhB [Phycisphaerae bacterium]